MKTTEDKKSKIKQSIQETREKRKTQRCCVFELKIDYSKLNKIQKENLKMYFVEAKWLYNFFLSNNDIFKQSDKIDKVLTKNKEGEFVEKELKYLPSKLKQSILYQLRQNIINLSKVKKNKHGKLKFKREINSLDFNQYENTHRIIDNRRIRLSGIKKPLIVKGLEQVKDCEIANAKLIKKASGYYIKLTCFKNLLEKDFNFINKKGDIGIDFGIKDNIVTSNGEFFNIKIQEDESLKRLQKQLAKKKKGSKNSYKMKFKLRRKYEKISNQKQDKVNKLVNYLCLNHNTIFMQDENIKGWHAGLFGRQIQMSALGSLKSKLSKQNNVKIIDRFLPTTKLCFHCGKRLDIKLSDRIFKCDCGYEEQRDIKSAKTILYFGRFNINYIPVERRESTLLEKKTSGNESKDSNLSYASMKKEAKVL